MKRLSAEELDCLAAKLEMIELEEESVRSKITEQIEEYGFTPARAEKSKRVLGNLFSFTLSGSSSTEVLDSEVEKIKASCPEELFDSLFSIRTSYKLAKDALKILAKPLAPGAPSNLRRLFAAAVRIKENSPRLVIKAVSAEP